jgi:hypothetical protein
MIINFISRVTEGLTMIMPYDLSYDKLRENRHENPLRHSAYKWCMIHEWRLNMNRKMSIEYS